MKKNVLILSIIVCCLLCSCTVIHGKLFVEIKDKNGDDISLVVLTQEDICAEIPESYCMSFYSSSKETEEIGDWFYDVDDEVNLSANSLFSGVDYAQATYGKTNSISFSVTSVLTEGNLAIFLIDLDSMAIIHKFEVNTTETLELENTLDGKYEIRIAGESAKFDITVLREYN